MSLPATDSGYLKYQYDDSEKLRIRIDTHARFTVGERDFNATLLERLQPTEGQHLLDVGCGPGLQHALLVSRGLRLPVSIYRSAWSVKRKPQVIERDMCRRVP